MFKFHVESLLRVTFDNKQPRILFNAISSIIFSLLLKRDKRGEAKEFFIRHRFDAAGVWLKIQRELLKNYNLDDFFPSSGFSSISLSQHCLLLQKKIINRRNHSIFQLKYNEELWLERQAINLLALRAQ